MRNGYVYIFTCVTFVSIGIFVMVYLTTHQTNTSSNDKITSQCTDVEKARKLAEDVLGTIRTSTVDYQFESIDCVQVVGSNGIPAMLINVYYRSESTGRELRFTEDSALTKVIDVTPLPLSRFGG